MSITPPTARYQQIADLMRAAIHRGEFAPGAALPSETQLAQQYGLSRTTVRQALNVLRSEGLVVTQHGSGTFVSSAVPLPLSRHVGVLRPDAQIGPWERRIIESRVSTSREEVGDMSITPPTARYQQIADLLRAAIHRGEFPPGAALPTETQLVQQYGLSRTTVRQALGILRSEGLVVTQHGSGTFVRQRSAITVPLSRYVGVLRPDAPIGPWEAACEAQGIPGHTELVSVAREPADPELAQWLELPEDTDVVHRRRHMLAHDQVVQIQDAWLPADVVDGTPLAEPAKVTTGAYAALIAAGHPPATADEHVSARMPTTEEAALLQAGAGVPVLVIARTTRDGSRRVLEALQVIATADRTALLYDDLPLRLPESPAKDSAT